MELHQLRYFAKVAELANFTRAAEACAVSQPALSQQIAKLEKELGQPLFDRGARTVRLTPAGLELRQRAEDILRRIDDAARAIADAPDAGTLRVGAIPTIAPYLLPGMLGPFLAARPQARVELVEQPTAVLLRKLADGELDLAVLALPIPPEGIDAAPLLDEELLALLPAAHPLAKKKRVTLPDLAAEPFVLLDEAHCLTGAALSFCGRPRAALATAALHQLATVQELVRLGLGVSLLPAMACRRLPEGVVARPIGPAPPTRRLALARHAERFRTRLSEAFAAELSAYAADFSTPLDRRQA